jgi:hypothetical protein
MLATGKNFWGQYLDKWKLLSSDPYVVMAKADTALLARQDSAAKVRAHAELQRLKTAYKVTDDQQAILRYKAEYDANTAALEKAEQSGSVKFIENPPLTLDDPLDFKTTWIDSIPMTSSTFNNMTSATTGIAFRLDNIPADLLVYLSMLPRLLTQTGIIRDGKAISYEGHGTATTSGDTQPDQLLCEQLYEEQGGACGQRRRQQCHGSAARC